MRRTPYPTTAGTNSGGSLSPRAEVQLGSQPLRDITNTEDHGSSRNSPHTAIGTGPGRSSSSNPEALRPLRNSFRDILDNEPVLTMSNPRTRNESSEDSQDNTSTITALMEYGRSIREEGTRDRSTDSSESSAGDTARPGRPRTRGLARPRS